MRDARGLDPVVVVLDANLRLLTYVDGDYVYQPETVGLDVTPGAIYYIGIVNHHGSAGSFRIEYATGGGAPAASGQAWVKEVSPARHAVQRSATNTFTVSFARPLQSSSVTSEAVRIIDGVSGAVVPATRSYDPAAQRLTVTPSGKLLPNRPYRLDVSGVRDTLGAVLVGLRVPVTTGGVGRGFESRQPVRVLDTRDGIGVAQQRIGPGEHVDLQVTGANGVPADAEAVVLNVTGVNPTRATYVAVTPTPPGTAIEQPSTSSLNLGAGEVRANQVTVKVGDQGRVRLFNYGGDIDVVADLGGWYRTGSGSGYEPLPPARILDTRQGVGAPKARVGARKHVDLVVAGKGGVPTDASAALINVTAVKPTRGTYVSVNPTPLLGVSTPKVSNINLLAGEIVPNLVSVPIGADGKVRLFNYGGQIDLVGDVIGYFSPHGRKAFEPVRLLDTRDGTGTEVRTVGADEYRDLSVARNPLLPSEGIQAVVLNVTGVEPTLPTWVSAFPAPASGNPRPSTSTLNLVAGEIRPNAAVPPLGHLGKVRFYNYAGDVDVLADAVGYFRESEFG